MDAKLEVMAAIQSGDSPRLQKLLADDPSAAAARDSHGVSAIMQALYAGRADLAGLLQDAKPELDIFEATSLGQPDRVSELISRDPSLVTFWSPDGFTPLHFACFFGQEEPVRLLLSHRAEVNVASQNPMKVMPLHSAAAARQIAIVRMLLEHKADPNAKQQAGWTPLHAAAQHGDQEILKLLLQLGADPSIANEAGVTATQLAREKGHTQLLRFLGAA
jgi:uncharacterized protein